VPVAYHFAIEECNAENPMGLVVRFVGALLVAAAAGSALAQPPGGPPPGRRQDWAGGRMSGEERQRLREDLQRQHPNPARADPGRADPGRDERARRYAEWQRLSPEQREGIRREMRDANRDFDRRR
jgi:uncharacterized membrane protein